MKKIFYVAMIGLLIMPRLGAQEQKGAAAEMMKNLQIVEKPEAVPTRAQPGFGSINARDMMTIMTFLSSDQLEGREIGSRGYDTAAAYAQSLFALWGLKPGGDLPKPAGGPFGPFQPQQPAAKPERGYLQEFEMKEALESQTSAILESGRSGFSRVSRSFAPEIDFVFSSILPLEVSAPLVFAGYGISEKSISYDDLAAIDVKDKIVLILSEAPGKDDAASPFQKKEIKEKYFPARPSRHGGIDYTKAAAIIKRGALAVLVARNSLSENGDIHREILARQQVSDDKPILPDSRKKLLIPGSKAFPWEGRSIIRISREMADAILETANETVESLQNKITSRYKPHSFRLPGSSSLRLSNQVRYQLLKSANVIAFIEGSDPQLKEQALVIGGHLDHLGRRGEYIYNGAEDNASGACGVLAMARALALNPEKPKRSIVFCLWTGEEEGLLGSRYYVEHPVFSMDNTMAYFNLDMIANSWDEKGLQRMLRMLNVKEGEELLKKIKPENFLPLSLSAEAPELKSSLQEANRSVGFDVLYRETAQNINRMGGGSDHASFAMAGKPWAFFMTGMSEIYHTPADSMEKFNGATMEKVSRLIYLAAFLLADK
ncbi:MAG: M20/M25/M40 family metallo-hydrolase [Candidatus Aminicenantes bacterium]|nr:M20/M25/M40 family metallo-hydrolase [Candidatus Aminicenantes bacterium]